MALRPHVVHTPRSCRESVHNVSTVTQARGVGSQPEHMHPVILVVAASGGLGASTLAAVLARTVDGVLVDGAVEGTGADATLAREVEPGLRWPDLAALDGAVEGSRLVARLPGADPPVLSAAGPCRLGHAAVASAVEALRASSPVVVDVPAIVLAGQPWLDWADHVVVLAGLRPRQVRDAEVVVRDLRRRGARPVLVTRGARRSEGVGERVADHLGIPLVDHLEDHPGVQRDEGCGRPPRSRGPVGRVAREVVATVSSSGWKSSSGSNGSDGSDGSVGSDGSDGSVGRDESVADIAGGEPLWRRRAG